MTRSDGTERGIAMVKHVVALCRLVIAEHTSYQTMLNHTTTYYTICQLVIPNHTKPYRTICQLVIPNHSIPYYTICRLVIAEPATSLETSPVVWGGGGGGIPIIQLYLCCALVYVHCCSVIDFHLFFCSRKHSGVISTCGTLGGEEGWWSAVECNAVDVIVQCYIAEEKHNFH